MLFLSGELHLETSYCVLYHRQGLMLLKMPHCALLCIDALAFYIVIVEVICICE